MLDLVCLGFGNFYRNIAMDDSIMHDIPQNRSQCWYTWCNTSALRLDLRGLRPRKHPECRRVFFSVAIIKRYELRYIRIQNFVVYAVDVQLARGKFGSREL